MAVKFTNKHNLDESFVRAILVDDHVSLGDISVTQLIDAPQIRQLKKLNNIEMDVMDMVGMALGTGMHTILERGDLKGSKEAVILQRASGILKAHGEQKAADYLMKVISEKLQESINDDVITEQTLTMEILGWTISGTFDRYTQSLKKLQDYKTTAASAVMFPEQKKAWDAQLNTYAVIMRANGFEVDKAEIIAILKDWSKMKIMTNRDYPRTPVVSHEVKLLEDEVVISYLEKRVRLHQRADAGEHIPCTPKERWAKTDSWAVKKSTGKRALSVSDSPEGAEAWIDSNSYKYKEGELVIEHRKAESFRCANGYCMVSEFCPQYAKEKEEATQAAEEM
jgi:hypothetical protein